MHMKKMRHARKPPRYIYLMWLKILATTPVDPLWNRDSANHAGGGRGSSGLQALYFLSDDAVALAGGRFQTFVVENPDFALRVRDQTGGLEYAQGYGDPGPACTQHHRQELMAELNVVVIDAIARHEEPPREPLLKSYAVRCMPQSGISG